MEKLRFIDLFCGIGGFRTAMDQACIENNLIPECVFSSDIDIYCQDSYEANFGHRPAVTLLKLTKKIFLTTTFYLQAFHPNHSVL